MMNSSSVTSAALDALRKSGMKVSTDRMPVISPNWLFVIHVPKFEVYLDLGDNKKAQVPLIQLIPEAQFPKRIAYHLVQFVECAIKRHDFWVQMLEGDPSERIPLSDVQKIVEAAWLACDAHGEMGMTFLPRDPDLPF
ncbi:hypothetical protein [Paraburkholderia kururiensis]|uniref:hypothetical protein n=1 Tax=Paraburkholderia kururiensis TaxID=984307 RepID=UPI00034D7962|nr:hypothetical protein [Paraburkholderia kururiensis]